jgi:hypothetical protein
MPGIIPGAMPPIIPGIIPPIGIGIIIGIMGMPPCCTGMPEGIDIGIAFIGVIRGASGAVARRATLSPAAARRDVPEAGQRALSSATLEAPPPGRLRAASPYFCAGAPGCGWVSSKSQVDR